ncbi:MAG: leucine-rich repeat domain-containing protein [Bacteroides sp.]|nr:leucine-rich repeat domain-containing protein [Bacteroides sp.]
MKTDLLKLLTSLVVAVLWSVNAYAYYDEVWEWEDVGENEAIITGCNPELVVGDVVVPSYVYKRLVDEFGQPIQTLEVRTVTYIGEGAFKNCTGITSICLPSELLEVGNETFFGCTGLKQLIIPPSETVKKILTIGSDGKGNDFMDCPIESLILGRDTPYLWLPKLTSLTLLDGLTQFPTLYTGDSRISSIIKKIYTSDKLWMSLDHSQRSFKFGSTEGWELLDYDGKPITELDYRESDVRTLSFQNAYCTTIKSVYFPSGMELPDYYLYPVVGLFSGCTALESVELPSDLKTLPEYMFSKCTALKTFTIPEGVETIYLNAFYESGLQSLYLPANIKEMKSYLWGIEVNDVFIPSLEAWMNIRRDESTCSFFIGNLHIDGKVLSDLYVPEGVTEIPLCCFSGVKSLSSVHLPNSISKIDSSSFYYCENLKDVEIKDDVTSIGDYAFAYCPLSSFDFPSSLASIGEVAFNECNIEGTLVLPEDLSELGTGCFWNNKIDNIILPQSLKSIPGIAFAGNPLQSFPDLSNVSILEREAFYATDPSSLILPENVKVIESNAFGNCPNLIDVVIADSDEILECKESGSYPWRAPFELSPVKNLYIGRDIQGGLFRMDGVNTENITTLEYVTLGSLVKNAQTLDCSTSAGLKLLESKALTPPAMNEFTADQYASVEVVVPEEAVETYKAAPVWKNFLRINSSTAIDDIATDNAEVIARSYYDLQGHSIDNPETGLFICHEILSDGTTVVRKVIRR